MARPRVPWRELSTALSWVERGWYDRALEALLELHAEHADPRLLRVLEALRPGAREHLGILFHDPVQGAAFQARLDEGLRQAAARPPAGALEGRAGALLASLEAKLRPEAGREEALWAAVHADPESDEARLVLADALTQRGDPRGEFILLQIESARTGRVTARERALVKQHGDVWLGRLRWSVAYPVYRRGFLAEAKHKSGALDQPEWRTLEVLEWEYAIAYREVLEPNLRQLRKTFGLDGDALRRAGERGLVLAAEHLGVSDPFGPFGDEELVRRVLPRLRRLDVFWRDDAETLEPLLRAPVEVVGCNAELEALPDAISLLRAAPPGRALVLGLRGSWSHLDAEDWPTWTVTVRVAPSLQVRVRHHGRAVAPAERERLVAALRGLGAEEIGVEGGKLAAEERAALADALAPLGARLALR